MCVTCIDGRSTTPEPTTSSTPHTTTNKPTTSSTSHTTTNKPVSTVKTSEITYNLTVDQNSVVGYTEPSQAA